MIGRVLSLIKTLFDIIRLRKGPAAIPNSALVLAITAVMWVLVGAVLVEIHDAFDVDDLLIGMFTAVVAWACYGAILAVFDRGAILWSTLSAVTGCGALLTAIFNAVFVTASVFVGPEQAFAAAFPILLWSVPVEGFIIARAAGKPWLFGFLIALTVYFLQFYLDVIIDPPAVQTS